MTGSGRKASKRQAKDAFGTPVADVRTYTKRPVVRSERSFKRAFDKVARTISGREEPRW